MRKLKFLQRVEVKDSEKTIYEQGDIIEVDNDASAERWLKRGLVEEIIEPEKQKKAAATKA